MLSGENESLSEKNIESQNLFDVDDSNWGSIVSVVTTTNKIKEAENQDSCEIAVNHKLKMKAVVIADGLGSYQYADLASKIAVKCIKNQIEEFTSKEDISFFKMFEKVKTSFVQTAEQLEKEKDINLNWENSFGTTLIVAIEYENQIIIAYVGNGAIWHIRGNFNHFHKSKYLPWNAINYLNPHTVQNEFGKEAMYKLISISADRNELYPTIVQINTDDLFFGDIIMICTDGIYSYDQVPIGKVKNGSIWISGERTISLFFKYLNDYFASTANLSSKTLQIALQNYLDCLKNDDILEDDATIGIMINTSAIKYQKKYQKQSNEQK